MSWFEEANEKLLGLVVRDLPDDDYACYVLGRDAKSRFRAVHVDVSLATAEEAQAKLADRLSEFAAKPPEEFHQGDEIGEALDFFAAQVPAEKQHSNFRHLISSREHSPSLGLLTEMMHYFEDVDGNFIQQFQSSGFDARIWELYLYALFTELGYGFNREHEAPDFHCQGPLGDFFVEATTVNPSADPPKVDEESEADYFNHYVPIKFGSALFTKLKKRYWERPHVVGHPFVIAVQDFHAPRSMSWSNLALAEYLYGIRQTETREPDGSRGVESERIEQYRWNDKTIPSGFFLQPETEHISAVLANPCGTLPKFSRIGFVAGFGDRSLRMIRKSIGFRSSNRLQQFVEEVHSPGYMETWCEGLSVYHNPNAKHPLPPIAIPGAAHHTSREGQIFSKLPVFHPVGSLTVIVATD